MIRLCPTPLKEEPFRKSILEAIHSLLKIPTDKTFEGASVYVGNLILLSFELVLEKPDQEILQEVVLKVFKSRTPSVIQSLVLVYSRIINNKTDPLQPFARGEWEPKLNALTDFLASFSIENRMGLKILVDKWLLQQSLFRGNLTKISTYSLPHAALWLSPKCSSFAIKKSKTCWSSASTPPTPTSATTSMRPSKSSPPSSAVSITKWAVEMRRLKTRKRPQTFN
jgi:hypothetical protein